jgi:phosphoglycerate dehydrogenase-like enzyme
MHHPARSGAPVAELPVLLPEADVVILSTPLTAATRGLVGAGFLFRMKDGALLVNVARGAVVDTEALLAEMELWHTPGVLITPHVGGPTSAYLPRAKRLPREQLVRFAAGAPLVNEVASTGWTASPRPVRRASERSESVR